MQDFVIYIAMIFYFALTIFFVRKEDRLLSNGKLFNSQKIIKKQKQWLAILIIFGTGICACRGLNTPDTEAYVNWYLRWDVSSISSFFKFSGEVEIGFEFVSKIIKLIFGKFSAFYLGIIAMIILLIASLAIWDITDKRILSYMLYFWIFGFYYSFIVIRQGIALSIILFAFSKIQKNKSFYILKLMTAILTASLFHRTAWLCLLMIPFIGGKIFCKKGTLYVILIISLFLKIIKKSIFLVADFFMWVMNFLPQSGLLFKIEAYFSQVTVSNASNNFTVLPIFLCIILFTSNKEIINLNNRAMISFESIGAFIVGFLSGLPTAIRFADYFLMAECFLLPKANYKIGKTTNKLLCVAICFFYLVLRIYLLINLT